MMRSRLAWLVLLGPLSLLGCAMEEAAEVEEPVAMEEAATVSQDASQGTRAASAPEPMAVVGSGGAPAAPAETPRIPDRKLIRNVQMELAVKDTTAASRRVQAIVTGAGGFVEGMNGYRNGDLMFYTMTLRLPADRLDQALEAIRGLAVRVDHEQLATEDATSRYVDLQSQLRNLQATEAELRELLAESRERSRKVEEVMAIYRELTGIRGQIEHIQGQLQSIDRLSSLSTVQLEIRTDAGAKPIVGDEWRPSETVRMSFSALVAVLQFAVNALIICVIVVLPILLPLWFLLRFLQRRKKRVEDAAA
jgi:hypothetical protein